MTIDQGALARQAEIAARAANVIPVMYVEDDTLMGCIKRLSDRNRMQVTDGRYVIRPIGSILFTPQQFADRLVNSPMAAIILASAEMRIYANEADVRETGAVVRYASLRGWIDWRGGEVPVPMNTRDAAGDPASTAEQIFYMHGSFEICWQTEAEVAAAAAFTNAGNAGERIAYRPEVDTEHPLADPFAFEGDHTVLYYLDPRGEGTLGIQYDA